MNGYVVFLIIVGNTLHFVTCQGCKPVLDDTAESREGLNRRLDCNINGILACTSIIDYMMWERWSARDQEWDKAFQIGENLVYQQFPTRHGYALGTRATGVITGEIYELRITGTIIDDSGDWRCVVIDSTGGRHVGEKNNVNVTLVTLPKENITITSYPVYLVPTRPTIYKCVVERCYPEVVPVWEVAGVTHTTDPNITYNGYVYRIESTITLTINNILDPSVTCILKKEDGIPWEQLNVLEFTANNIQLPPVIETLPASVIDITFDSLLTLECVVSGTGVTIMWMRDDNPLGESLFKEELDPEFDGDYSFGAKTATKSKLTWIKPSGSLCSEKLKHAGGYICTARGVDDISVEGHSSKVEFSVKPGCLSTGGLVGIIITVVIVFVVVPSVIAGIIIYKKKKNQNEHSGSTN